MMRFCGKQSAACFSNTWSSVLVPCRLRLCQKVSFSRQDQRLSRCNLVVSAAKRLSNLAEDGVVRQVSQSEFSFSGVSFKTCAIAANLCPNLLQEWPSGSKRRLDEACLEQRPLVARNVMHSWIVQGKVQVNGKVVSKPGTPVSAKAKIDILAVVQQYVCRYVNSWRLSAVGGALTACLHAKWRSDS